MAPKTVFLFDVDNTLLDHDHVTADLRAYLDTEVGTANAGKYWQIFENIRAELGYADYLGALQRFRLEFPRETRLLAVSSYLIQYPFANRLFPGSLDAVKHVQTWGANVILSDGDVVFQPRKIARSGLQEAFNSRVLIYIHKETELGDVEARFPAEHYVIIDDKLRILAAVKEVWGPRVTTVFVKQGHYANDPKASAQFPPADISLGRIGELVDVDFGKAVHRGR